VELQPTCYVYGPTGFVETVSDLSEVLACCPSWESVLLRMVRTFNALWLDMSGMSALRILMMINSTSESYYLQSTSMRWPRCPARRRDQRPLGPEICG
jgi:hypothetical protein